MKEDKLRKDKPDLLKSLFETENSMDEINKITEIIIGCAYKVSNALGCGFLEKVYENALTYEIRKSGLEAKQQEIIKVYYDSVEVGLYEADILVADKVLIELKAVKNFDDIHKAQCLNYLKATGLNILSNKFWKTANRNKTNCSVNPKKICVYLCPSVVSKKIRK